MSGINIKLSSEEQDILRHILIAVLEGPDSGLLTQHIFAQVDRTRAGNILKNILRRVP